MPSSLKEIMISAYQSYLWNECIKQLLIRKIDKRKLYSIKYNIGSLIFYKSLTEDEAKNIPQTFKTISDQIEPTDFEAGIINKVLAREGIALKDFDIKKQTGNFFKTHERNVLLKPSDFRISSPVMDELNDRGRKNTFKITLSFVLPKGSYATVITKRIFNQ